MIRVAFYGRVSTEDQQDPVASKGGNFDGRSNWWTRTGGTSSRSSSTSD